MKAFDADAHVEESPETFSDDFFDPEVRDRRPQVVTVEGQGPFWAIEGRMFPRRTGKGAYHFATPAAADGKLAAHTATKKDEPGSITLADVDARLRQMDADGITEQVIYPTLFLAYPLSDDPALGNAMCSSYNRWIKHTCDKRPDRLKWVCVVNLGDVDAAVVEVRRARADGAIGCMILGTVDEKPLNDASLDPFYAALVDLDLALAVHVGWSAPSLATLYDTVYDSLVMPFTTTLFTGFLHVLTGGVLDRFPQLRVAFFEAGCQWIPFLVERMEHYYEVGVGRGRWPYRGQKRPLDYIASGNVFFGFEVDDHLLPHVISMIGDDKLIYASDIPHGDREWDSVVKFTGRTDVSEESKQKLLVDNAHRYYRL